MTEQSLEGALADLQSEHDADVDARLHAVACAISEETGCQPLTAIRSMLQNAKGIGERLTLSTETVETWCREADFDDE
jgi:dimeric dUTPase (all-alpha-NTP-PPase superfamily)